MRIRADSEEYNSIDFFSQFLTACFPIKSEPRFFIEFPYSALGKTALVINKSARASWTLIHAAGSVNHIALIIIGLFQGGRSHADDERAGRPPPWWISLCALSPGKCTLCAYDVLAHQSFWLALTHSFAERGETERAHASFPIKYNHGTCFLHLMLMNRNSWVPSPSFLRASPSRGEIRRNAAKFPFLQMQRHRNMLYGRWWS